MLVLLFWSGSFVECCVLIGCYFQVTISNYAKFPQCIQGDNGPLNLLGQCLIRLCKQHVKPVKASTWRLLYHVPDLIQTLQRCVVLLACAVQVTSVIYPQTLAVMLGCVLCVLPGNCNKDYDCNTLTNNNSTANI